MAGMTITFEELTALAETELGTSEWIRVDQDRVNQFADATEDHQWIHVDPVRAADGPFGKTIAHGYLMLSLVPHLLDGLLKVSDQVRGTNYGIDRARFTSPVPIDSEVCLTGRLLEVRPRDDGGLQYKVRVEMKVRNEDRPALVAECIYLTYGR